MTSPAHPSPLRARQLPRQIAGLLLPMLAVLVLGTAGFMWTEGWGTEQSLFFTIITFTTVGYGDYELSVAGHRVAIAVIIVGFGTFTYVLGQIVQIFVERRLDWERIMQRKASQLTDHYIIVGFGRIGRAVCARLAEEDIPFVIVDRDRRLVEEAVRCGYTGLVADATHDDVLRECAIDRARGIACLSSSDANNIVITLSARALCPELHIISRAESADHLRKIRRAGADRVVSPEQSGAVVIANSILRPHAIDFLDQATGRETGVEFSKFTVLPGSDLEGRTIAEAPGTAESPVVIVAIETADGTTRISPPPTDRLHAGDTLIIAGHPGAVVSFCADAA